MKRLCEEVKNAIDSGKYYAICVSCEDFSQSIEATQELIDSGVVKHGDSGASKKVYRGETYEGDELLYLDIITTCVDPYIEYYYVRPADTYDICMINFEDFIDAEDIRAPDIGAFLGI